MKRLRTSTLCIVIIAFQFLCFGQSRTLLVVDFQKSISKPFLKTFWRFRADLPHFNDELRRQIVSSKALEIKVSGMANTQVGKNLLYGYGKDMKLQSLRSDLSAIQEMDTTRKYLLVGRVSDDVSNIVFVDAEIYELLDDTIHDPLRSRIHIEASQEEAFAKKMSLASYLIEKLVLDIEARLDERIRVLLTPFKFYGDDRSIEHLGGMISSLLGNRLSISHNIRIVTLDTLAESKKSHTPGFRQWTLPELGRREAAKYVIGGTFFRYDSTLGIEADHIDAETGHSVLSKSVLVRPLSGENLYRCVNGLGDEIRRAIELDYSIKSAKKSITIAVVGIKPFPTTDQNCEVTLEIANTISRILRTLPLTSGRTISVVTDERRMKEYVREEIETAVIGRDMNAQYLWTVRCERPGKKFNIEFNLLDLKNPSPISEPTRRKGVGMENISDSVKRMLHEVVNSKQYLQGVFKLDSSALKDINVRTPEKTIAVVPGPVYPGSLGEEKFAQDIARIVFAKLGTLQAVTNQIRVVQTEQSFDDYMEMKELKADSIARELHCVYLWVIEYKKLGHIRRVKMELINTANPFDSTIVEQFTVDHQDHLADLVNAATKRMIEKWQPGIGARAPYGWDTSSTVNEELDKTSYRTDAASIRFRGSIVGFLEDSKAVFLGNAYRYALELSAIYYRRPLQYELMLAYDFGKTTGEKLVYGRYFSAVVRYNFPFDPIVRDMRLYIGAGVTAFNVVRVKGEVGGRINGGFVLTGGFEIPLSRFVYFDFNSQFLKPLTPTNLGGAFTTSDFREGFITSLTMGFGIGFRIQ